MPDDLVEFEGMECHFEEDNPEVMQCRDPDTGETERVSAEEIFD